MKKIFIMFLLIISIIFIPSCNKEDDLENENNNDQNNNNTIIDDQNGLNNNETRNFNVSYKIADYTVHKTTIKGDEKIPLFNHLYLSQMPKEMLEAVLNEYDYYVHNHNYLFNIYEVHWFVDGVRIDENYVIQDDIVLQGEIVTGFYFPFVMDGYNLIGGVVFSKYNVVEYPKEAYLPFTEDIISCGKLTLYNVDIDTRDYGILPDVSENNILGNYRQINIEEIIVPSEILCNGMFEYMFAQASTIKKITVNGDVSLISKSTFKNLTNLESIIINGNVEKVEEDAITNCPNASLIINK